MSKARQLADLGNVYDDGALSHRNLIINGAMQVAQRGTSVTGIGNGNTACQTVDRFRFVEGGSPTYALTVTQSTDAPNGFAYSYKYEVTTAQSSLASGDILAMDYSIEGQDLQHLKWGTSSAQKLTLSFWVKSSNTGTYVAWFYQWDDTRAITTTYTIDAADTWEYKTITIVGDTTGVLDNDSNKSLLIRWTMASGTGSTSGTASDTWRADVTTNRYVGLDVNLADTVGNTFLLTGVQLELGDTSTPFEHIPYSDQLARCQRYYEEGFGYNDAGTTYVRELVQFIATKRASPTVTIRSKRPDGNGDNSAGKYYQGSSNKNTGSPDAEPISQDGYRMEINPGFTADTDIYWKWEADAEL